MKIFTMLLVIAICSFAVAAKAQDESAAFAAANNKMMTDMDMKPTGNADKDFVAMMIPHHQGAIDMAKVELQYGHDKTLRDLATRIIAAQEKEIALMKSVQASR